MLEYARDAGVLVTVPTQNPQLRKVLSPEMAEGKAGTDNFEFMASDDQARWEAEPLLKPDLKKMSDALSDSQVVLSCAFQAAGLRSTPLLELTDENNLMKIANGKLDPETGKFIKDKNHPVPNYTLALALQGYLPAKREIAGLLPAEGAYMLAQHAGWVTPHPADFLMNVDFTSMEMRVVERVLRDKAAGVNMDAGLWNPDVQTGREPGEPEMQHISYKLATPTGRASSKEPSRTNIGKCAEHPRPVFNTTGAETGRNVPKPVDPLSSEQLDSLRQLGQEEPAGTSVERMAVAASLYGGGVVAVKPEVLAAAVGTIEPVDEVRDGTPKPEEPRVHRQTGTNMPSKVQMPTESSGFNMQPQQPNEALYNSDQVGLIANFIRRGDLHAAADTMLHNMPASLPPGKTGIILNSIRLTPPGGPSGILFRYSESEQA